MKAVKIFIVLILLFFATSDDTFSQVKHHHRNQRPTVGAPLDGGILAALGAAGVAYFAIRKKKKNNQDV